MWQELHTNWHEFQADNSQYIFITKVVSQGGHALGSPKFRNHRGWTMQKEALLGWVWVSPNASRSQSQSCSAFIPSALTLECETGTSIVAKN